jgi:hypothetical protein
MKVIEDNSKRKNRIETVEFTLNEKFGLIAIAAVVSAVVITAYTMRKKGK